MSHFKDQIVKLKMNIWPRKDHHAVLKCGTKYPVTWHHIPDEGRPQQCCCTWLKNHIHECVITRGGRPVIMYINVVIHFLSITWIRWKCQILIWIYVMPNFSYICFCITISLNTWNKLDSDQYNSFSERSHIKYTWMLFPIYQNVIYLWVFPSAVVRECVDQLGFGFGKKFTSQTTLSLSVSCKLSFPIPSLCNHRQKSPNKIFMWYLFIYFILFPYIPFRYIPWKWKSHIQYTSSDNLHMV